MWWKIYYVQTNSITSVFSYSNYIPCVSARKPWSHHRKCYLFFHPSSPTKLITIMVCNETADWRCSASYMQHVCISCQYVCCLFQRKNLKFVKNYVVVIVWQFKKGIKSILLLGLNYCVWQLNITWNEGIAIFCPYRILYAGFGPNNDQRKMISSHNLYCSHSMLILSSVPQR